MRRATRFASSLVLAALAAAPAAAQQQAAGPRVIASYTLRSFSGDLPFARSILVADSAGTLVATALDATRQRKVPLTVTVLSGDVILQGATLDGVFTMVLNKANDGTASTPTRGIWTLGERQGTLVAAK